MSNDFIVNNGLQVGTWGGSIVPAAYGGTGVANLNTTLTLAGGNNITLTTTGTTNITLPTSGTVLTTANIGSAGVISSVTGTANQISASTSSGAVTLSLPSSVTISGTMQAGTFSGSGASLTSIPNSALVNSSVTVGTTAIALGSSATSISGLTQLTLTGAGNSNITGVGTPVNSSDAANKAYVDAVAAGLSWKQPVIAATTTSLSGTYVGSPSFTLTNSGTQAAFALDGVTLTVGQRVLLKNQATATQNGIYSVTTVGTASTNWVLTRTTDFNETTPINEINGAAVYVEQGTLYSNTGWTQIDTVTTLDTNPIAFAQFTGAGSGVSSVTAGTGISTSAATGAITLTNTGVTSIAAGTNVTISGSTGAVTINAATQVPSLAATYVGYGSSTGSLTGTSDFTWSDSSATLALGNTTSNVIQVPNSSSLMLIAGINSVANSPSAIVIKSNYAGLGSISIGAGSGVVSGGNGAPISISAGSGSSTSSIAGSGGSVTIAAGTGGSGPAVGGTGGALNLSAGNCGYGSGGSVTITSGNGYAGFTSGSITIATGYTNSAANVGVITLETGGTASLTFNGYGAIGFNPSIGTSSISYGTAGQVITSNGPTSFAQWSSPSTLAVGSASAISGGAANQIPYQTAASTTSFIAAPSTSGTVLEWTGTAFSWVTPVTSVVGTANQVSTSTSSGTVTLSLASNVVIPAPSSGATFTATGAANTSGPFLFVSGSSATGTHGDLVVQRAGSTANALSQGPNLYLVDSTTTTESTIQQSGGQTEFWQNTAATPSSFLQTMFIATNGGVVINGTTTGGGGPSGGSKGPGTINATGLYVNGVAVGTGSITSVSGTANQITASTSSGAVTLSLPSTISGLTSVSSTAFVGALTGNASTATNIAGGTANQIPYQTGAGTTSFFSAANYGVQIYGSSGVPSALAGSAGVLQGSASAVPTFTTTPTLTGTNFSAIPNAALVNSSVTVNAGPGLSGGGAVALGSSVTLNNAGVTSVVAGTGISVSGATGAVTVNNTGPSLANVYTVASLRI